MECYEASNEVLEIIHQFVEGYTHDSRENPADGHMVQYPGGDPSILLKESSQNEIPSKTTN